MNKLFMSRVYLSGPIDAALDFGVGWREEITPFLRSLNIGIFNPCDKPCDDSEGPLEQELLQRAEEENDLEYLIPACKKIVGVDLRMVHLSDFLICYIDRDIQMFGTPVEITWAVQQRKPVLTVVKQGKTKVNRFLRGMIPNQEIFSSFQEMQDYLVSIDNGTLDVSGLRRWHFFDYERVYRDAIKR